MIFTYDIINYKEADNDQYIISTHKNDEKLIRLI